MFEKETASLGTWFGDDKRRAFLAKSKFTLYGAAAALDVTVKSTPASSVRAGVTAQFLATNPNGVYSETQVGSEFVYISI